MAIRHLEQVLELLKSRAPETFSKTQIRDELRIDYNAVLESLAYLLKNEKIKEVREGNITKYAYGNP